MFALLIPVKRGGRVRQVAFAVADPHGINSSFLNGTRGLCEDRALFIYQTRRTEVFFLY